MGQRTVERASYRNNLEQIVLADRMGFDTVWCVEHHFREGHSHMPCSEAVLAAISQITSKIKLGFGVTLAPHEFIHPARIAEKVATVDLLSGGRVQWGIGRSTPMEQTAFGVDRQRSKAQMLAAAKTVVGMWEQANHALNPSNIACTDYFTLQCALVPGFSGSVGDAQWKLAARSRGVYAQATYKLSDRFSVTGGVRYTWDRASSSMRQVTTRHGRDALWHFATIRSPQPRCELELGRRCTNRPVGVHDQRYQ